MSNPLFILSTTLTGVKYFSLFLLVFVYFALVIDALSDRSRIPVIWRFIVLSPFIILFFFMIGLNKPSIQADNIPLANTINKETKK